MKFTKILFASSLILPCLVVGQNTFDPDDVVELEFKIGDNSGSHSERWRMTVTGGPQPLKPQSPDYGEVGTTTSRQFRKGNSYTVTVDHQGTHPDYTTSTQDETRQAKYNEQSWYNSPSPDYDYQAQVFINTEGVGYWIEDDQGEGERNLLGFSNGSETNEASGKQAMVHLVKVKLPDSPYTKPNGTSGLEPNQIICNDVQFPASFPSLPEDERSVAIAFDITPQAVLDRAIDKFNFVIASSVTEDFGAGNGTIGDTEFVSSKGAQPIVFEAKQEFLTDKSWDNPRLQPQTLGIAVEFDGTQVFLLADTEGYNPVRVLSRLRYLVDWRNEHDKALSFVEFKFGLLETNPAPEYDPSQTGSASGITIAQGNMITSWIVGVYLNTSAFNTGAFCASVIVHELSHVNDGADIILAASRGRNEYDNWAAGGFTGSLSSSDVDDIRDLIATELDATNAQMTDTTWQYLSPDQQSDITSYQNEFLQMEAELVAAGY